MTIPPHLLHFLARVKDDPGPDEPRLAVADWLAAHGRDDAERDRAEFIRLQCRRARLAASHWDHRVVTALPEYKDALARETALRRAHLPSWAGEWGTALARPDCEEHWFHRGMLRPWLMGSRWLDDGLKDRTAWAWVDGLTLLSVTAEDVSRVAGSPLLREIDALHLGQDSWGDETACGDAGAAALAASPHLVRLRSLELSDTGIGPQGVRALADAPWVENLDRLEFSGFDCTTSNFIGDAGARALAESPRLTRLTSLSLITADVADRGAEALAASPYLSGLTHLGLCGNRIGPAGALALAASPHLGRLTHLALDLANQYSDPRRPGGDGTPAQDVERAKAALRERFGSAWVI